MLVGLRDRLIHNRTQLSNAIRGYAVEFGLTAAKGMAHLDRLLERIQAMKAAGRGSELFAVQAKEYAQLEAQIDDVEARLKAWHKTMNAANGSSRSPASPDRRGSAENEDPAPSCFDRAAICSLDRLDAKDHSTPAKSGSAASPGRR